MMNSAIRPAAVNAKLRYLTPFNGVHILFPGEGHDPIL
jgi:hypothetical protein